MLQVYLDQELIDTTVLKFCEDSILIQAMKDDYILLLKLLKNKNESTLGYVPDGVFKEIISYCGLHQHKFKILNELRTR